MRGEPYFEVISRAVIEDERGILVCRIKGKDYYFLPGGHVEFGEDPLKALHRELEEELGAQCTGGRFIGAINNVFTEDGMQHHEINLIFSLAMDEPSIESKEEHIEFFFLDRDTFSREQILPAVLQEEIVRWWERKEIFYQSNAEGAS